MASLSGRDINFEKGLWDPIAAALRYQTQFNPRFLMDADQLGGLTPTLQSAIESFSKPGNSGTGSIGDTLPIPDITRESRTSGDANSEARETQLDNAVSFGRSDSVKNLNRREIKEETNEVLFTLSGPIGQLRKIEALEHSLDTNAVYFRTDPSGDVNNSVTVNTELPVSIDKTGVIALPFPPNGNLAEITITAKVQGQDSTVTLTPKDYLLVRSPEGFLLVSPTSTHDHYNISYKVNMPEEDQPKRELPRELQRLNTAYLKTLANQLKNAGFLALSENILSMIKTNRESKKPTSLIDLGNVIKESADYSYNGQSSTVDKDVLAELSKFVDPQTGRAKFQCDASNRLSAFIFSEYLRLAKLDGKYKILETGLRFIEVSEPQPGSETTTATASALGHQRLHLADNLGTIAIFDNTPSEPGESSSYGTQTPLDVVLADLLNDPKLRRIYAGLSDYQLQHMDIPVVEIPKVAYAVAEAARQRAMGLEPDMKAINERFDRAAANLRRQMAALESGTDPWATTIQDGDIRASLYKNLHHMDRIFGDLIGISLQDMKIEKRSLETTSNIQNINRHIRDILPY